MGSVILNPNLSTFNIEVLVIPSAMAATTTYQGVVCKTTYRFVPVMTQTNPLLFPGAVSFCNSHIACDIDNKEYLMRLYVAYNRMYILESCLLFRFDFLSAVCENIRLYIEKYEEFQECLNDFALVWSLLIAISTFSSRDRLPFFMFESWFVEYKVDVVFLGHVHAYERSERVSNIAYNIINGMCAPVKDQFAPIYITIGDGENIEGLAINMIVPQPNYSAY
ncbi:hypothetical protein AAG906_039763 [Vitis piasezkii]